MLLSFQIIWHCGFSRSIVYIVSKHCVYLNTYKNYLSRKDKMSYLERNVCIIRLILKYIFIILNVVFTMEHNKALG